MNRTDKLLTKLHRVLAIFAIILGLAHLVFGLVVFEQFNLQLVWFLSAGVAMIVTALANLNTRRNWVLRTQNAVMLGFVIMLVIFVSQPQVWLGIFLFAGLLGISCTNHRA